MSASSGTVYLRGKSWTINYSVDGRRIREAIGGSKKLAEMVLKKRVTEAIENRWFSKRNVGLTPFSEFADTYINRHISLLKSINTFAEDMSMKDATSTCQRIVNFLSSLNKVFTQKVAAFLSSNGQIGKVSRRSDCLRIFVS